MQYLRYYAFNRGGGYAERDDEQVTSVAYSSIAVALQGHARLSNLTNKSH